MMASPPSSISCQILTERIFLKRCQIKEVFCAKMLDQRDCLWYNHGQEL